MKADVYINGVLLKKKKRSILKVWKTRQVVRGREKPPLTLKRGLTGGDKGPKAGETYPWRKAR